MTTTTTNAERLAQLQRKASSKRNRFHGELRKLRDQRVRLLADRSTRAAVRHLEFMQLEAIRMLSLQPLPALACDEAWLVKASMVEGMANALERSLPERDDIIRLAGEVAAAIEDLVVFKAKLRELEGDR